jgi:hypothetical protein
MAGDEYLAEVEGRTQGLKLKLVMAYSSCMKKLGTKTTDKGGHAVWYQGIAGGSECIVDDKRGYNRFTAFARMHGKVNVLNLAS